MLKGVVVAVAAELAAKNAQQPVVSIVEVCRNGYFGDSLQFPGKT
jgi:hypothetical protein